MYIPQERFIKIGKINTRYMAEGEGSPVVLIHGMGGSAAGWLQNFGAFAAQYHVYAMDLPGHGGTDPAGDALPDPAFMSGFVNDFMAEMNIERAHVAGHSMGGGVSLRLAIDYPDRVDKLVLVDSLGFGKELSLLFKIVSLPILGEWLAARDYRMDIKKYAAATRKSARNTAYITDELIAELYRVERKPEHVKPLLKTVRQWVDWTGTKKSVYGPILEQLPSIKNRTLIIWGRQDSIIPLAHGELAVKILTDARTAASSRSAQSRRHESAISRLEVIDQCDHVPLFEQPEIFNRLLLDFLKDG